MRVPPLAALLVVLAVVAPATAASAHSHTLRGDAGWVRVDGALLAQALKVHVPPACGKPAFDLVVDDPHLHHVTDHEDAHHTRTRTYDATGTNSERSWHVTLRVVQDAAFRLSATGTMAVHRAGCAEHQHVALDLRKTHDLHGPTADGHRAHVVLDHALDVLVARVGVTVNCGPAGRMPFGADITGWRLVERTRWTDDHGVRHSRQTFTRPANTYATVTVHATHDPFGHAHASGTVVTDAGIYHHGAPMKCLGRTTFTLG